MGLFDGLSPTVVAPTALGRRNPGHKVMLQDAARVEPYREALAKAVRPGCTVADLGCGTGVLGLLALKAGAGRLYAIEAAHTIRVAERVARDSGLSERCRFLQGLSRSVSLPERVDVLVAEILGDFCYEEQILDLTIDARERFLKPGGSLVPFAVRAFLVPMEHPAFYDEEIGFWTRPVFGLDYGALRELAVHQEYSFSIGTEGFLAEPAVAFAHDLRTTRETGVACSLEFRAVRSGTLHGLGGWFEADLAEGVTLSTAPDRPETTWRQVFFPVSRPVAVKAGDVLRAEVKGEVRDGGFAWSWTVAGQAHANGRGLAALPSGGGDPMPELPEARRAELLVLAQCDGRRSMEQAAEILCCEFPGLYPDRTAALRGIVELLRKYTKTV